MVISAQELYADQKKRNPNILGGALGTALTEQQANPMSTLSGASPGVPENRIEGNSMYQDYMANQPQPSQPWQQNSQITGRMPGAANQLMGTSGGGMPIPGITTGASNANPMAGVQAPNYGSQDYFQNIANQYTAGAGPELALGAERTRNLLPGQLTSSALPNIYSRNVEQPYQAGLQKLLSGEISNVSQYNRDLPFKEAELMGMYGGNPTLEGQRLSQQGSQFDAEQQRLRDLADMQREWELAKAAGSLAGNFMFPGGGGYGGGGGTSGGGGINIPGTGEGEVFGGGGFGGGSPFSDNGIFGGGGVNMDWLNGANPFGEGGIFGGGGINNPFENPIQGDLQFLDPRNWSIGNPLDFFSDASGVVGDIASGASNLLTGGAGSLLSGAAGLLNPLGTLYGASQGLEWLGDTLGADYVKPSKWDFTAPGSILGDIFGRTPSFEEQAAQKAIAEGEQYKQDYIQKAMSGDKEAMQGRLGLIQQTYQKAQQGDPQAIAELQAYYKNDPEMLTAYLSGNANKYVDSQRMAQAGERAAASALVGKRAREDTPWFQQGFKNENDYNSYLAAIQRIGGRA